MSKAFDVESNRICKAVDLFAEKMKDKMLFKQRQGYSGWSNKNNYNDIEKYLHQHVVRQIHGFQLKRGGQEFDIANFCMMLYFMNNGGVPKKKDSE